MVSHMTAELLRDIANRYEKVELLPDRKEVDLFIIELFEVCRLMADQARD